jgi:vitamin B12 transporter
MFIADTPPETVIVTASRLPEKSSETAASVTVLDRATIEHLAPPTLGDLLRLVPSAAVATGGPAGSLTQVRIRGAEANHTLLTIDGIRANDPAAANEPRFEMLNADLASRVEVVRGPQSALWGSEAIGGVIAVTGAGPEAGTQALVEAGSFGFGRAAARSSFGTNERFLSFAVAGQGARGIDSFNGDGDRDGYRNLGGRIAGQWRASPSLAFGGSGFALRGRSQFDGYDPLTFLHADTLDETRNKLAAGRVFGELGRRETRYLSVSASLLGSTNRNFLDENFLNRTRARRRTASIEGGMAFGRHKLIVAAEDERERFRAMDTVYGGATDQRQTRAHRSLTAEWKSDFKVLRTDVSIRRDMFSRFADATSLRGSVVVPLRDGYEIAATYGEGIAQPSFFDLYGFFPGSFVGNPSLRPERSRGGEVSLRHRDSRLDWAITAYRQRLRNEIVGTFDPDTFLSSTTNGEGKSRRRGVEVEAGWQARPALRLAVTYAYLKADEPGSGGALLREQRRPKHSGSVTVDGASGRLSYGASVAFVGARVDTDFDRFPAERVRLSCYALVGGRLGWRLTNGIEANVRVANLLDQHYVDAVGYRTEGRSVNVGIRLTPRL